MTTPSPLALSIAEHLKECWFIQSAERVRGYVERQNVPTAKVAEAIDAVLLPRLAAHAIEDALQSSVNASSYPDGPNLPREIRQGLRDALKELKP